MTSRNETLFAQSQYYIPGGVNSPVRAYRSVGGTPPFIKRGQGARIWDEDGNEYIDYVLSWGPLILGHAHADVIASVCEVARLGLSFGAPTAMELEFAELLCHLVPSMEQVRLVSSGTEATMSAIRLARGYTGRSLVIKFEGCYHGHADMLLVKAGSGGLTFGQPTSAGVPLRATEQTLVLSYNDVPGLHEAFAESGQDIAAVIVEPVAGNMNLIAPSMEFLTALRALCTEHGSVLIFDEVMTGFRVALGGAQALFNIQPDLCTLGKVIGGGMPLGAFGGRREIMQALSPAGSVYQAGTLSGNPVAVAAGLATLKLIRQPGFYEALAQRAEDLVSGLRAAAEAHGVAFSAQAVGGMFGIYFCPQIPHSYKEVIACEQANFKQFFQIMLQRGIYLAPSAYEAGFISSAHSDADIALTLDAAGEAMAAVARL